VTVDMKPLTRFTMFGVVSLSIDHLQACERQRSD
jgi:hypothetical protein